MKSLLLVTAFLLLGCINLLSAQTTIFEKFGLPADGCSVEEANQATPDYVPNWRVRKEQDEFSREVIKLPYDPFLAFQNLATEAGFTFPEKDDLVEYPFYNGSKLKVEKRTATLSTAEDEVLKKYTFDQVYQNLYALEFIGFEGAFGNLYDSKGEPVFAPERYVGFLPQDFGYVVRTLTGYGLIDHEGNDILAPDFKYIETKNNFPWVRIVPKKEKPYLYNYHTGRTINFNAPVTKWRILDNGYFANNDAIIDPSGQRAVWCDLENRLHFYPLSDRGDFFTVRPLDKEEYYLVRLDGTIINSIPSLRPVKLFDNGLMVIVKEVEIDGHYEERYAFFNESDQQLTEWRFTNVKDYSIWDLMLANDENKRTNYYDRELNPVFPLRDYSRINPSYGDSTLTATWKIDKVTYQQVYDHKTRSLSDTSVTTNTSRMDFPPPARSEKKDEAVPVGITQTKQGPKLIDSAENKIYNLNYKLEPASVAGTFLWLDYKLPKRAYYWVDENLNYLTTTYRGQELTVPLEISPFTSSTSLIQLSPDSTLLLLADGTVKPAPYPKMVYESPLNGVYVFSTTEHGLAETTKISRQGLIDSTGQVILPPVYNLITSEFYYLNTSFMAGKRKNGDGLKGDLRVVINGKINLLKPDGTWKFSEHYEAIIPIIKNAYIVRKNGMWGVYDTIKNQLIIPIAYEAITAGTGLFFAKTPEGEIREFTFTGRDVTIE